MLSKNKFLFVVLHLMSRGWKVFCDSLIQYYYGGYDAMYKTKVLHFVFIDKEPEEDCIALLINMFGKIKYKEPLDEEGSGYLLCRIDDIDINFHQVCCSEHYLEIPFLMFNFDNILYANNEYTFLKEVNTGKIVIELNPDIEEHAKVLRYLRLRDVSSIFEVSNSPLKFITSSDSDCSICLNKIDEDKITQTKCCKKVFHIDCFVKYLISEIDTKDYPVCFLPCVNDDNELKIY